MIRANNIKSDLRTLVFRRPLVGSCETVMTTPVMNELGYQRQYSSLFVAIDITARTLEQHGADGVRGNEIALAGH
jgi:hypothetical protein